jgi:hypothetical protein
MGSSGHIGGGFSTEDVQALASHVAESVEKHDPTPLYSVDEGVVERAKEMAADFTSQVNDLVGGNS